MIKAKNNHVLTQDEKISPTTECLLVYMALERIDARLPCEIDRIFGHRMDDSTTLFDLQTEIFSYIPKALESLDRSDAELNAYYMHGMTPDASAEPSRHEQEPAINAIYNRSYQNPRATARPYSRQNLSSRPQNNTYNRVNIKICKLCQALDLPPSVVNSHNTDQCRKKNQLQQIDLQEQLQQLQLQETAGHQDEYDDYQD